MTQTRLRVSLRDETLWSNDPRVGLIPDAPGDQGAKLQTMLDMISHRSIGGQPSKGFLLPGQYRVNPTLLPGGELAMTPTTGHRHVTLQGAGNMGGNNGPTVIVFTNDAGAGKWAIRKDQTAALYEISDLAVYALSPTLSPKGHPGWGMRGLHANNRGTIRDVTVAGLQCGIGIVGDHQNIHDCIVQGNVFGIEFPTGQNSQGDILLRKVQADGCSKAGLGVAKDCSVAGFKWIDGSFGNSPYGVLRYDVPGATSPPNWMAGGVIFDTVASEFIGNGVVYDAVGDGAGMVGVKWLNNTIDWSLYNPGVEWAYNGESRPKVAAWYNAGGIELEVGEGFPTSANGLPAIKSGGTVTLYAPRSGRAALTTVVSGGRLVESSGSSSAVASVRFGTPSDSRAVVIHAHLLATGQTVARGELLTNSGANAAKKYTGAADERIIGVATQAGDAADATTKVAHVLVRGNNSDVQVKNTSGSTIATDKLLKGHSGGGVQAATGATDPAQIIGRALGNIDPGLLGQAELFI